jgi:hypothetical protein
MDPNGELSIGKITKKTLNKPRTIQYPWGKKHLAADEGLSA